jgi:hypothetical protein
MQALYCTEAEHSVVYCAKGGVLLNPCPLSLGGQMTPASLRTGDLEMLVHNHHEDILQLNNGNPVSSGRWINQPTTMEDMEASAPARLGRCLPRPCVHVFGGVWHGSGRLERRLFLWGCQN